MKLIEALREFVSSVVAEQRRVREAEISGDRRVPHGSSAHVRDLEKRIADLTKWRNKQKRGSDRRADYHRLVQRLKAELASARRASEKH